LTTANERMRLMLFVLEKAEFQREKFLRLVSYCFHLSANVHADPIHPQAPKGPTNILFLQRLLLDFNKMMKCWLTRV